MKRFLLFLMAFGGLSPFLQKAMAEHVYLQTIQELNGTGGNYLVPSRHEMELFDGTIYKYDVTELNGTSFNFRIGVAEWGDKLIAPKNNNAPLVVNPDESSVTKSPWSHYKSTDNTWIVYKNDYPSLTIYVDISSNEKIWVVGNTGSGISYRDTEFEMVATDGIKTVILPLSCARVRNEGNPGDNTGEMSTKLFTVGFKDEALPGVAGNDVKVYIRGKNNPNAQYRPATDGSTLGNMYELMNFTSLSDLRNEAYITGSTAANSSNTFIIKKGSGVSYTVGLNLGSEITATGKCKYPVANTIKAHSLTLYTNTSLDTYFGNMFGSSYKNTPNVTKKEQLEDYYILGDIYGDNVDGETEANYIRGYMFPGHENWDKTCNGTPVINYFKMEKQVYLNPNDPNKVDSIVYSKIVPRPASGSYANLYMSFAPKSLADYGNSYQWTGDSYVKEHKWNYVIRPEVFDQKDGTAVTGSVFITGVNNNSKRNGEQSLNPQVQNDKEYYIIRLNTTTSTYRVEFVNKGEYPISKNGIRTFCSRFNYEIPEGYAAYAAQSFEKVENRSLNGQPNGNVKLRRLKFIPANEPVVLIYTKNFAHPFDDSNVAVTADMKVITDGAGDPNHYLDLETEEEWWVKNYTDDYHNLLVAALDAEQIENGKYHDAGNGKYHYDYRHFALNQYKKTDYFQHNGVPEGENYIGFFRAEGLVPATYAYLRLTDKDLNYNGQLLGDINSNIDELPAASTTAPSKFGYVFDVAPWDDVTAIREVKTQVASDDAYYTLQGMKVKNPTKGLYIHRGKKIMVNK